MPRKKDKGMESAEVSQKDAAAENWCENASALAGTFWQYRKIPQKAFEVLQPRQIGRLGSPYIFHSGFVISGDICPCRPQQQCSIMTVAERQKALIVWQSASRYLAILYV